jgi:hypothetical protein
MQEAVDNACEGLSLGSLGSLTFLFAFFLFDRFCFRF